MDEWKEKIDASPIESALSTLQIVIARPAALFDPYAAIAALDEVANVMKEKKYKRVSQGRPLANNPCLQQVLIKLAASKEEAEVAKVIAKATQRPVPVNQGSSTGRTRKAPYHRRGTSFSPRPPSEGSAGCVERRNISRAPARTSVKDCVISKSDLS